MFISHSRPALPLTVLAAVALHVAVGLWLLASPGDRFGMSRSGPAHAPPVTLVWIQRAAATTPLQPEAAREQVDPSPAPKSSSRHGTEARPEEPAGTTRSKPASMVGPLRALAAPPAQMGDTPFGGLERFEPASLPGEPLVPLGDADAAVAGHITLRVTIDETGRVVDSQVVAREGLTDSAVTTLIRSFTSLEYLPARRGGRPVRSEASMVVGVRDGGISTAP